MEAENKVEKLLDELYASARQNPNAWGGKGYLVERVARECGVTKAEARRRFEAWAERKGEPE